MNTTFSIINLSCYAPTSFSSSLRKEVVENYIRIVVIRSSITGTDIVEIIPNGKICKAMHAFVDKESAILP